jgi:hypothetical protein
MSILDTQHDDVTVEFEATTVTAVEAPPRVARPSRPTTVPVESRRPARTSMFARIVARVAASGRDKDRGLIFAAEPAVYEEYRASLARRNNAREASLRD